MYNRIVKVAIDIGRSFGWDLEATRVLCSQLRQYKSYEPPFDLPFASSHDDPLQWWNCIELEENHIQQLAIYLFSICPNSASCERGFSTLGWLTGKRRLRFSVEKLETITKLISFYRSNAHKELVFYGKLNEKLSDYQILAAVRNAIAEAYEEEEEDVDELSRTLSSDIIEDVTVVIESLTIEQIINLNNHLIIDSLGRIPEEDIDVLDDDQTSIVASNSNSNSNNETIVGRGVLNFSNDDLLEEFGE
jgi:hypothetical protein